MYKRQAEGKLNLSARDLGYSALVVSQFTLYGDTKKAVSYTHLVVEEKTLPVTATTNYLRIADGYILYSTEVSKETVTLSGPSSELSKVATCTAEASYDSELTESVTLDTPLRFYTSGGKEVKFQYTTLEESNVDVTLQVYKLSLIHISLCGRRLQKGSVRGH